MASSNICWGIEIGAGAIKALKLEAGDSGVNVLDYAVIQHPKVLSTPGIDQNDVLRVSIGTLTSQYDLSKAAIAVSVPGHSAFARFAKLPPVEPRKVPAIVKFEAVQQIPFPLEQVEWDYQTFIAPDSPEVEVGIFAITRERIMERLQMLQDVGIVPNYVTLSPIAAYNALAYDLQFSETTPGTIILDVGTTSSDLVVAEAGRVWVRTFPIGGHQFTEALVNQFKLSYPKAEKLKREAEEGVNARHVFQAMRPVFTDLAQDVQRSIGYYQSLHKDAKLVRLIGVGSTFSLPGLRKYLKQQLSMDVYRLEEFKRLSCASLGDEKREGECKSASLQLTTAYGLALQGLGLTPISANLMPVSVIRESMWKGKVKWFGAAAGLAAVAGAGMFIRPAMDYAAISSRPKPAIIDTAFREANEQKLKAEEAKVVGSPEPDFRAVNILSLLDARAIHAHLVNDLGQIMADADAKAGGAPSPSGAPAGYTLRVFKTDYEFPETGSTDEAAVPPEARGQSEGEDTTADPAVTSGSLPPELANQPRVKCRLTLSTSQPDPRMFALKTIDTWLRTHAKRDGVPYIIVADPDTQFFSVTEDAAISSASTPATGNSGAAPAVALPGRPRETARSARDAAEQAQRQAHGEAREGRNLGRGEVEQRGSSPQATGAGSSRPTGDGDKLAPLDLIKPVEPPGKKATIDVTWEVVILPPPAPKTAESAEGGAK